MTTTYRRIAAAAANLKRDNLISYLRGLPEAQPRVQRTRVMSMAHCLSETDSADARGGVAGDRGGGLLLRLLRRALHRAAPPRAPMRKTRAQRAAPSPRQNPMRHPSCIILG